MKKIASFLVFIIAISVANSTQAQVSKGNVMIDPYIGFPTGNLFFGSVSNNLEYRTVGPPVSFGGRIEYMLLDNIGIGLDVNYVISGYQYLDKNYYDQETNTQIEAVYKYQVTKLRSMVRFNYHFFQSTEFDIYTGFGFGYRQSTRTASYNNIPTTTYYGDGIYLNSPIAIRFCIGAKYYFSNNIGAFLELGSSGGSAVQLGLSIKL